MGFISIDQLISMNKTIHVAPETSVKFNNGEELEEIKKQKQVCVTSSSLSNENQIKITNTPRK